MTFRELIDAALEGSVSVQSFCSAIEHEWNFGDECAALSEVEKAPLQQLFDVVVYYSPFPHERARIPHYRSEEDVLAAAQICREALPQLVARMRQSAPDPLRTSTHAPRLFGLDSVALLLK